MKRRDDLVTASEIASWAWCPESWRLSALGAEPSNRADMARGETHHASKAAFEEDSRSFISVGWCLLAFAVLAALVACLALFLAGEA
jgi:hypothetical protein